MSKGMITGRVVPVMFLTVLIAATGNAQGQSVMPTRETELVAGCGKAQAAIRQHRIELIKEQLRDEYARTLAAGLREAHDASDVLHCDLAIEIIPGQYDNMVGSNTFTIQSKTGDLTTFTFRLADQYNITSAMVNGATPIVVSDLSATTRVANLDRSYGMDEILTLTIEYNGHAESGGFGSIEFDTHAGTTIVYTLSEAYFSYTWWPAKDGDIYQSGDNSDKFTLDMAVTSPGSMVTASNGSLQGIDTLSGQRVRYRWASDYPISSYLVCFSSTNYNTWSVDYYPLTGGTMPVDFYIYPESDSSSNRAAWEKTLDMLYTFRELYGEYPFADEKYGIYQCNFGGGMEHQTFTAQGTFSESVTAHELSHQWWGDMITCKTWNDIWLNEGPARYSEALWAEFKPGSSGLAALKSTMSSFKYTGGGSVYVTAAEIGSMSAIFDINTTYNKAGWVMHMLRHVVGNDNFFDALAAYRSAHEYGAASTADFQAAFEPFFPSGDLSWFFQEWIYGERCPSYAWGWESTVVNGKQYLLVYVDQTQSSSYQRFTMPLDIVVDGQTYVIFNDNDPEHFVIPLSAEPSSVELDPDAWVLWSGRSNIGYTAGPPTIVETSPAPNQTAIGMDVDTVTITFHTNVSTDADDYSLVGSVAGVRSFDFAYNSETNTVTLSTHSPLPLDEYTLTVDDAVAGVTTGLALDGEIVASTMSSPLPSGDGVAGGAAVIAFRVACAFGDSDCDGDIDVADFAAFQQCFSGDGAPHAGGSVCQSFDLDEDDDVDLSDYAQFAQRLGGPNTEDCNGNGISDEVDIVFGTSADCNGNEVPDECELAGSDCNANSIPDECELEDNDCNTNGVPDECDPPVVVFATDLDIDPGWTTQGLWQFGVPQGSGGSAHGYADPSSGHTGSHVYGYNLDGDYSNSMNEYHLTSSAIDCSGSNDTRLRFWRYLNVEDPEWDHAYVRISTDGVNWDTVWENSSEITDDEWVEMVLDISGTADNHPTIYLRWIMGTTDYAYAYSGWNIDDIRIEGWGCPQ